MAISPADHVGSYRILSHLGSGGMGEVYRAHDERIGRDVAIKILPSNVTSDPERLNRFAQEARTAGSLNHPNLVTIYELGNHEGAPFIAMELLEGQTLRERMAEPLPKRKVLDYAVQIAQGLAAAHLSGVVHRDLKPENIFVTRDGRVKILDFGLAKLAAAPSPADANALTAKMVATTPGMILGTVGYMSPEQVRGEAVDARSDLFSFGVILYELLTSRRPFVRDSTVETLNAILKDDPPEFDRDQQIPAAAGRIVLQCLEKDREHRYQSARDLALSLQAMGLESTSSTERAPALPVDVRRRRPLALGALLLTAIAVAAGILLGRGPLQAPHVIPRLRYLSFAGTEWSPAASPDGRTVAFTSRRDGTARIWIRQMANSEEVALTSGPDDAARFSRDGSSILFTRTSATPALYRVAAVGGEARKVVSNAFDGDWSPDAKRIVFVRNTTIGGLSQMCVFVVDLATGRETLLYQSQGMILTSPRFSPDGKRVAVCVAGGATTVSGAVVVVDLESSPPAPSLIPTRSARPGGVAWVNASTLVWSRLDGLGAFSTSPTTVILSNADGTKQRNLVSLPAGGGGLDVLPGGGLLVSVVTPRQNLSERTADGFVRSLTRGNSTDRQPAYSPDGKSIVFSSDRGGNLDVWEVDRATGNLRRLTDHPADDWDPQITPDGKHLLWSSSREGHFEIWMADRDGSSPRRISSDGLDAENPTQSVDGWIYYASGSPQKAGLWRVRPDGTGAQMMVRGTPTHPEISPTGRYVAYHHGVGDQTDKLTVFRVADGAAMTLAVGYGSASAVDPITPGRARWLADESGIVFTGRDAEGRFGLYVQNFVFGQDTTATRRPFAPFSEQIAVESHGVAPDGKTHVISVLEPMNTIVLAEDVDALR